METVWAILTVIVGVVGTGVIIYLVRNLDRDRHREDDARTFFDEHGHWPDQTLAEAEAERAALLAASAAARSVQPSTPTSDGFV